MRKEERVESKPQLVEIEKLRPADSPRLSGEDMEHSRRLAEVDGRLPPILVHRETMRVIDGMHRLRAAELKGRRTIDVEFFDGTEEAAFLRGVKANITHGLPLSLPDRRSAAARIITTMPRLSDRAIAEHTGLAPMTVAGVRRELTGAREQGETRVGGDGRRRPVNGSDGRRRAAEAIAAQPTAPLREIARIAGVSLGTAHAVRSSLLQSQNLVTTSKEAAPKGRRDTRTSTVITEREQRSRSHRDRLLRIQRDPTLRFSELGKELLRLLHTLHIAEHRIARMAEAVPPHLTPIVADIARHNAKIWNDFANLLQKHRNRQVKTGG